MHVHCTCLVSQVSRCTVTVHNSNDYEEDSGLVVKVKSNLSASPATGLFILRATHTKRIILECNMIREDDPFMVLEFHVRLSHQNNLHIIIILILYSFLKSTQSSVCFLCFLENLKDTYYRVGNLNFSALTLWARDIQIVLVQIRFHSPNTPSPKKK